MGRRVAKDRGVNPKQSNIMKADLRPTLSRAEAVTVYDGFALKGHIGGKDASSGYGGPAIAALLSMAAFADAKVNHPCALVLK